MSTKEKLIERFKKQPKDFTWNELVRLFGFFGFVADNKGKTSGSGIVFKDGIVKYEIHKPHPTKILKRYMMKSILNFLIEEGYIKIED
ncbi:MAG: type II toxin-antitoxin system HicA family toxin [Bacteroidales bacterium]|nr:type II toxin-antitoxin system HicA family toxin [Bacteroidales bacterium]